MNKKHTIGCYLQHWFQVQNTIRLIVWSEPEQQ